MNIPFLVFDTQEGNGLHLKKYRIDFNNFIPCEVKNLSFRPCFYGGKLSLWKEGYSPAKSTTKTRRLINNHATYREAL